MDIYRIDNNVKDLNAYLLKVPEIEAAYVSKAELYENDYAYNRTLTQYATTQYVDEKVDEIAVPDLSSYATIEYVDNAIDNIDIPEIDLSDYYTKSQVNDKIEEIPPTDLSDYYTKQEVDNKIEESNLISDNKDIILEVKNTGAPIKKEDEEKIFERFYKIDESRNRNSNNYGLGLAIAKNIVERHNGTISAHSEKGYTTFKVIWNQK